MNNFETTSTLPARFLAILIDYVVVSGLFIAVSQLVPLQMASGSIAFLAGAAYFSLGHSIIGKGQTIGKALLGLRVVRFETALAGGSVPTALSISRAFFRYFLTYGLLIGIAEIPPAAYRSYEIVAPSWMLELHMLVAFALFFANCARVLADPLHRGFHDSLTGSLVARPEGIEAEFRVALRTNPRTAAISAGAALFSIIPWWFGIERPDSVEAVLRSKYLLENRLNIRILNAQPIAEGILVEALLLGADSLRGRTGIDNFKSTATELLRKTDDVGTASSAAQVRFRLYSDPGEEPLTKTGEPLEVLLESGSLSGSR